MTLDSRILFSKTVEELFGVNYTVINSKKLQFFFFTHFHQSKTSTYIIRRKSRQNSHNKHGRKLINLTQLLLQSKS